MSKWQGTPVPNTGYVENVYFNTNLSVDEVVGLLNDVNVPSGYGLLYIPSVTNSFDVQINEGMIIIVDNNDVIYFHNVEAQKESLGFIGWNPNINYPISINNEVVSSVGDSEIGYLNSQLSILFSTTPFDEEQLTLNSFLTGIADAIRSKKGTTEPINASNFASEIEKIQTGIEPTGTLDITENGEHNVRKYENVNVNVKGGITLNPVTNIALSEDGLLSWDAPNTSEIEDKLVSISYVINLNETELTSDTNSISVSDYLVGGENIVSVKAIIGLYNEETQSVVEYVAEIQVILLETKLPSARSRTSAVLVDTNTYIFGGEEGISTNKWIGEILKFDTATETITTLSTTLPNYSDWSQAALVGTNIYIFGGQNKNMIFKFDITTETLTTSATAFKAQNRFSRVGTFGTNIYIFGGWGVNEILKFDTTTETLITLSATLPLETAYQTVEVIGTNAYIFGGHSKSYSGGTNIYKFDIITETLTTLNTQLPYNRYSSCSVHIGTNVYIFGDKNKPTEILKFDTATETITTLSTTLPQKVFDSSAIAIGEKAYIFGGGNYQTRYDTILKVINLT